MVLWTASQPAPLRLSRLLGLRGAGRRTATGQTAELLWQQGRAEQSTEHCFLLLKRGESIATGQVHTHCLPRPVLKPPQESGEAVRCCKWECSLDAQCRRAAGSETGKGFSGNGSHCGAWLDWLLRTYLRSGHDPRAEKRATPSANMCTFYRQNLITSIVVRSAFPCSGGPNKNKQAKLKAGRRCPYHSSKRACPTMPLTNKVRLQLHAFNPSRCIKYI